MLDVLAKVAGVVAVAIGGSNGRNQNDRWSDEDYFVFASDDRFIEVARAIQSCFQHRKNVLSVGNWGFSHRFGLKLTMLDSEYRTCEVFLNCPLTFAPLPMTRHMRFRDKESRSAFKEAFACYDSSSPVSLATTVESASGEIYDALRGMRKALKRGNRNAYSFYFRRFEVVFTALRLQLEQGMLYDPHHVERRRKDDLGIDNIADGEPLSASINRSLALLRRFSLDYPDEKRAENGIRSAIAHLAIND